MPNAILSKSISKCSESTALEYYFMKTNAIKSNFLLRDMFSKRSANAGYALKIISSSE